MLTIQKTVYGTSTVMTTRCPHCNKLCSGTETTWPKFCWSCHNELPTIRRHFFKRDTARLMYYKL